MPNKLLPRLAFALFVAQPAVMLLSWLLSSLFPESGMRSLIGSEGLRWLLGSFSAYMQSPLLLWLLLVAMAWGSLSRSGLLSVGEDAHGRIRCRIRRPAQYRERIALRLSLLFLVVCVGLMALLALAPHALLLSATGRLWPSPFSASFLPLTALVVALLGIIHGTVSGRYLSLSDVYSALLAGLRSAAPLFLFYVLVMQLICSVWFVFLP